MSPWPLVFHNNENIDRIESLLHFHYYEQLKKDRYKVTGPFSADTIFLNRKKYIYDVVIGMYHDQVLTPIKTIYGFDAINITLGLPFISFSALTIWGGE